MLTKIMELEIKVKEIGLFFLANSGRLAEAIEKLGMEEELNELLVSFKQIKDMFNKFKLEIIVENKKDLMYLWLLFSMGTSSLEKAYEGDARILQKIYDLGALDKGGICRMLDVEKMEEGL